ncbi:MAG TPA: SRPBCC domain-containing protein [Thermoanaerobaculia bacterium]|nr:SRPBCC domain-containing protein [Thermoanaerobaculia bacterium]
MSVKIDPETGERSVAMETEVPGTPEEVWRAVATGPGITAWFVPTEVAEREGGAIVFDLGPGMGSSTGVITGWEPPHRLAYEEREWMPGAPPVATELHVEAKAGGTCVVRMVHSLFTDKDDWDGQLESFENGWPPFFHVLAGYLRHFAGQLCAQVRVAGTVSGAAEDAWSALAGGLGLPEPREGERLAARAADAPALAGVVEWVGDREDQRGVVLRTEEPAPGFALLGAFAWGDAAHASLALYLYGKAGSAAARREADTWRAWMGERFPAGSTGG